MENRSFYRDLSMAGQSQQIDEEPLVVNCAGACVFHEPFQTWNREGRADYYLQYVTHGVLQVWMGEQVVSMQAGDFLLTRPRTPYRYFYPAAQETEEGEMGYLWAHFTGFHTGRLLSRLQLEPGVVYSTGEGSIQIQEMFNHLFGEFTSRQRGFDDACAARLTQILVQLSRAVSTASHTAERTLSTIVWLHSHFTEDIPMGELAVMEHLSESRYRTVFRKQTGLSPREYRIALRMQHACDLLTSSTLSINEISAACGYSDVLYFNRLFKRRIGVPPGEYRSRCQEQGT